MMKPTGCLRSRYITTVGRAYLLEVLYGSKYAPHIGTYSMPFLYVKTILMCASAYGLEKRESRYLHGLIECLLPSNASQDNLTKLELLQFVDAIPARDNTEWVESEENTNAEFASSSSSSSTSTAATRAHRTQSASSTSSTNPLFSRPSPEHVAPDAFSFLSSSTFPSSLARLLVYDAVAACVADSLYSASERERVALVASQVGLSAAEREHIERTALQERALSVRKRRLLCLADQPPHPPRRSAASTHAAPAEPTAPAPSSAATLMEADEDDDSMMDAAPDDGRHTQREQIRAYVRGHGAAADTAPLSKDADSSAPGQNGQTNRAGGRSPLRTGVTHVHAESAVSRPPMTHQEALRILRCQ